jgi:hypothetical protein
MKVQRQQKIKYQSFVGVKQMEKAIAAACRALF